MVSEALSYESSSSLDGTNDLLWCDASIDEIVDNSLRLEASTYAAGKNAKSFINKIKWPKKALAGKEGFSNAYVCPRFKRIWLGNIGIPLYQPSQITDINPEPRGYVSADTETNLERLIVKKGQILMTCSGTLGICNLVSKTLDNKLFSHDLIRINCYSKDDVGYVYAFLKTEIGSILISSSEYGAVISHLEPHHLAKIFIPNPSHDIKKRINELIIKSFDLRDYANELNERARNILYQELGISSIDSLSPSYFEQDIEVCNFSKKLSDLNGRLDASYHLPIVDEIINVLTSNSQSIYKAGNKTISKEIILPGRFKRVYVHKDHGVVFFGGKQIGELDPSNKKYISFKHHNKRIKEELTLKENMILITRSGTIGKVALVPAHWEGRAASEHIIRIIPVSTKIAGYIYIILSSDMGKELIKRYTYGAVVDEIDAYHAADIPIPILKNKDAIENINQLALLAKDKLTEAYNLEQEAIKIVNEEVLGL